MTAKLIQLPSPSVETNDTVRLLERLLREARAGTLTGVALTAFRQNGDYYCEIGGTAKDCPTFTRGAVKRLDDELSQLL